MNPITLPPFHVIDKSLCPCKLTLSESTGLSILGMKSDVVIENWKWCDVSHATIKSQPMRIVQLKKLSGVKKVVRFWSIEKLDCFQRVLKSSHPVKVVINIRFQRKLMILHAARIKSEKPALAFGIAKKQSKTPDPHASKCSCLNEMKTNFAGGVMKPSQIKAMVTSQPCVIPKAWSMEPKKIESSIKVKAEQTVQGMKPKPTLEPIHETRPVAEPNQFDINNN